MFKKIRVVFHKKKRTESRESASDEEGKVIGAFDEDEWLYERNQSNSENNLGEILSTEFIEMIERREKNCVRLQTESGNSATNNNTLEICENFAGAEEENDAVTSSVNSQLTSRYNNDDYDVVEEYVGMLLEESFAPVNEQLDTSAKSVTNDDGVVGGENMQETANEMFRDEEDEEDDTDNDSVMTAKHEAVNQDPIEERDISSSDADDLESNSVDDGGDTKRDDVTSLDDDDREKTLDCNHDKPKHSDTKTFETNESTTWDDHEQRTASYQAKDNLIPFKVA